MGSPSLIASYLGSFEAYQLYGMPSYTSPNKLRHDIVRQKDILRGQGVLSCIEGLDISLLPPCRTALNSIVFCQLPKSDMETSWYSLPDPEEHGWKKDANRVLSIHWCSDLVPQQIADILSKNQTTWQQESNNDDYIQSDEDSNADSQDPDSDRPSGEEEESG